MALGKGSRTVAIRTPLFLQSATSLPNTCNQHVIGWIPTILMAAAAIEAFPNDLLEVAGVGWSQDDRPARLRHLCQLLQCLDDSRASQLLKYEAMHFALTSEPLPLGTEPFQSLKLLIDVRNKIMHP